jgi:hypothetical protein
MNKTKSQAEIFQPIINREIRSNPKAVGKKKATVRPTTKATTSRSGLNELFKRIYYG